MPFSKSHRLRTIFNVNDYIAKTSTEYKDIFTAPLERILDFRKKHAHCIVIHNLSSFFSFQILEGTYDIQNLTKEEK